MDDLDLFVLQNDMIRFLDGLAEELDEETSIVVDVLLIQKSLVYLAEDEPNVAYSHHVLQIAEATGRILCAVSDEAHDKGVHIARQISEFTESVRRQYG